ncbi:hypothetical protein evm_013513 [Chilo suppressalis]|nr:hypothetical protein evm_013513 [Chilo suppressalis]
MAERKTQFITNHEDTVHANFFSYTKFEEDVHDAILLEELCDSVNKTINLLSKDYIWHKDELKVYIPILLESNETQVHLKSTTCFGGNIEDEWFIVYLIFEISRMFEDLIIQLTDNDGDFLLIEAANVLPSWANPESTENRIFIYKGHIHIIQPSLINLNTDFTIREALKLVIQLPEQTIASTDIEQVVWSRVGQYPQKIKQSFHNAVVNLPLDLATLLTLNPSFISAIVECYCNHDLFEVKYCQNVEYQDPIFVKVKFTKCLYAMLLHSKYIKINGCKEEKDKKYILGHKLICGFNMLMKRNIEDIFSTKEFMRFLNNLSDNGYFRQNIKDSKEYNKLLEKAKNYFLDMECPINTSVSKNISEVMVSDNFKTIKESLKKCNTDNISKLEDDSDEWLNISPHQLNEFLNTRYSDQIKFNKSDVMTPHAITKKISSFLKETSDFEGVDSITMRTDTRESESDNPCIDFDSDDFVNCLKKMLDFMSSENNSLDDSDIEKESDNTDREDEGLEEELASKLNLFSSNRNKSQAVMLNIAESVKEEGLTGPASNLLKTIGISKTDILLDSDDDD